MVLVASDVDLPYEPESCHCYDYALNAAVTFWLTATVFGLLRPSTIAIPEMTSSPMAYMDELH